MHLERVARSKATWKVRLKDSAAVDSNIFAKVGLPFMFRTLSLLRGRTNELYVATRLQSETVISRVKRCPASYELAWRSSEDYRACATKLA